MNKAIWTYGAADLAAAIAGRRLTARDAVDAVLERIEAVNPAVNAVTVVFADAARRAAGEADRAVADGRPLGPLHGVPFTVKENIDLAGSATTHGLIALKDAMPPLDAPAPARLKAAGAIPIGRTNMPEFGARWHTDNALRGATRNPWDAARTPGGSSGGEAAAVATGMTPIGLGNDLGGSLRIPAHCCGAAALKPTPGRIPHATSMEPFDPVLAAQMMLVQGPLARHVRDLRLAYEVMSGPDPRDPWSVPAPLQGPPLPTPIRVAVVTDPGGLGVDAAVASGVRVAADALADAGYDVVEAEPPGVVEASETWSVLARAEGAASALGEIAPLLSEGSRRYLELVSELVEITPHAVARGYVIRHALARQWSAFQVEHPVILGPVMTRPPFAVGDDLASVDSIQEIQTSLRLIVALNVLGLPAVVVPTGGIGGLPTAVQVIGSRYREDLCLDAAEAIERRLGVSTPIDPHQP
ncbi:amidase (plasmid) [Pseudonocardia bannensis]|uniref:Indole acetimide hydrolase n=1 Tax=Pseudonocardia bannensis TaxID=630973 RepID=A0A848DN20_9PSEU|nr:amidase [Pseudonocardia bannensis]NMH94177.1 indole acetimide hydrolase [Pseudonocardia bannensis]